MNSLSVAGQKRLRARLGQLRTAFGAGPGQSEEEALSQPGTEPRHFLRPFPSQKKESFLGEEEPKGGFVKSIAESIKV